MLRLFLLFSPPKAKLISSHSPGASILQFLAIDSKATTAKVDDEDADLFGEETAMETGLMHACMYYMQKSILFHLSHRRAVIFD